MKGRNLAGKWSYRLPPHPPRQMLTRCLQKSEQDRGVKWLNLIALLIRAGLFRASAKLRLPFWKLISRQMTKLGLPVDIVRRENRRIVYFAHLRAQGSNLNRLLQSDQ